MATTARKTTRKDAELSTTANVATSNVIPVLDDKLILQYVTTAFEESDLSAKYKGSAIQRIAAAIIAQYQVWRNSGHADPSVKSIPMLELCIEEKAPRGVATNRSTMLGLLKAKFVQPIPKDIEYTADERADLNTKRAAHGNLVDRGLSLAVIFVNNGIDRSAFNVQLGNFTVPPSLFLPEGHWWKGMLNSKDAPATVFLNNGGYSAEYKSETTGKMLPKRIQASVDAVFYAARSRKARTPAQGNGIDYSKVKPEECGAPIAWLVRALYAITSAPDADTVNVNGWMLSGDWQKLSDVAMWNDQVQSAKSFDKMALDRERGVKEAA